MTWYGRAVGRVGSDPDEEPVSDAPNVTQAAVGRLVLVDDEPAILDLLSSLFRGGWEVSAHTRGADALERLRSAPFDVLLTDKNLPDVGGLDLLGHARKLDPDAEVLMITGYASLDTAVQAMQLGAFDYIVKPPRSIFDVRRKVEQALDKVRLSRANRQLVLDLTRKNEELVEALAENKRVQAELVQSEKLAGIGTLAAGIAHEIASPLFGIMGLAEAVAEETDLDAAHRFATEIVDYSRTIAEIVGRVSDYSRSAELEEYAPVDAAMVAQDAARLVVRSMSLAEGLVEVAVPEGLSFHGRSSEAQQILVNLLKNAVDAVQERHEDGSGKVRLTAAQEGGLVLFRVADNGPGISEDRQRVIFDPFYTTKPIGKGTGLGLNIVWRLVTKVGGTVGVESVVGQGATFVVRFPAA